MTDGTAQHNPAQSIDNSPVYHCDPSIYAELQYIVQMHIVCGAPRRTESVDELITYILRSIADGSRRPGSWERGLLDSMGLVADTDEHHIYRSSYGPDASYVGEVEE